ncbi:MAG TPA: peptide chain release factor N(5)-glutamine methyltransferase [Gemmatimonadaceae bacterium]|nr:peptide chain release factor N(5)-glutamine methyltransferase [Gemmatimonadaceae bacterium]
MADDQGAGAPTAPSPAHSVAGAVAELGAALERAGVPQARAEARDMVAAMLDVPRFWPSLNPDAAVEPELWERARRAAGLRARGAPFAYAVGRAAFRHLTLRVDERVLIPRQETEMLIELVLGDAAASGGVAVDVGTGSGAIALSLATEGRFDRVVASDVSLGALAVARWNADALASRLRCPVELRHGSLLAPLAGVRARVLVSNPPYIAAPEAAALPPSVRDWEPPLALFSGADGLDATRAIVAGAPDLLEPGGLLALETDERRAGRVAELARADARFHDVRVLPDLTGRDRFVAARRSAR